MSIVTAIEQGIMTLQFNRPERKNAITSVMYQALADGLKEAEANPAVRVILLMGTAEIFTAGNDLDDFLNKPPRGAESPVFQFLYQISHASKPIVAAVRGAAVGVGTTMLMHCDLVYAADNARLSMPFAQLGLCPEAASSLILPQIAGYQNAAEKLLLGEAFSAEEAHRIGMVNRVLPADQVVDYARQQAIKLSELPASSVRMTKKLMKGSGIAAVEERMAQEGAQFGAMLTSPEAREAFKAFFEKRKPDFKQFA